MKSISELKDIHKGKTCYIVGTGPSIMKLQAEDFEDGFVIAVNSAIEQVEKLNLPIPVYCQYKDGNYPEEQCTVMTCGQCPKKQPVPKHAAILLHVHHAANCFPLSEPKYYFDNLEYGLQVTDFSQMSAIRNAELMGARALIFYGFDSITRKDCRKYTGEGYPAAYALQAERMKKFDYRLPYIYKEASAPKITEDIDLVYVLGNGSKWNDNEIRFSLRSVQKNLKGVRNIYVVGECPAFLQNVIHVPAKDIFDPSVNADGNMTHKLLQACNLPQLSDNFLFMNDDFIIMQPMVAAEIPWMHKGDMKDRPEAFWKEQFYRHRLRRTFETLRDRMQTTLQYDYHAPMLMNKNDFRLVMQQYDYAEGIGLTFRSIYGNAMQLPAEHLTTQKKTVYKNYTSAELVRLTENCGFLGYNDQGLNRSLIYFLWKNFQEQSNFEKNEIEDRTIEICSWLEGERDYWKGVAMFRKYLHGANVLRMFESGETPGLRRKLEFKFEMIYNELRGN